MANSRTSSRRLNTSWTWSRLFQIASPRRPKPRAIKSALESRLRIGCFSDFVMSCRSPRSGSNRHASRSQRPLRGWHARAAGVELAGHAEASRQPLEDRLANMVAVAAVVQEHVQVHPRVGRHGLPEIGDELAVEVADLG